MRATLRFATLFALLALLATPLQAANVLRLEAVGAVPIRGGERGKVAPKQQAIQAALREAVSRVAHDLLMDAGASQSGKGRRQALLPVLGKDMVRYTTSFRILEDRGERPALFVEAPDAATEYVVIVEVQVDADRVENRLVERGLLERRGREISTGEVRLEVLGMHQYGAYQELRSLLVDRVGARGVRPSELERGRTVLIVDTSLAPGELLHRLLAMAPAHLELAPLAAESEAVRLSVHWTPPPEPAAGAEAPPSGRRRR